MSEIINNFSLVSFVSGQCPVGFCGSTAPTDLILACMAARPRAGRESSWTLRKWSWQLWNQNIPVLNQTFTKPKPKIYINDISNSKNEAITETISKENRIKACQFKMKGASPRRELPDPPGLNMSQVGDEKIGWCLIQLDVWWENRKLQNIIKRYKRIKKGHGEWEISWLQYKNLQCRLFKGKILIMLARVHRFAHWNITSSAVVLFLIYQSGFAHLVLKVLWIIGPFNHMLKLYETITSVDSPEFRFCASRTSTPFLLKHKSSASAY